MWQDTLSTKSNAFARTTPIAQTPCSDQGAKNISFHNCTFNFGGVEGKGEDVEKIVSQIVDKLCAKGKRIVEEPVSILKKHSTKETQCIEHIDFGSMSDNTMVNAMATPEGHKNQQQQKDLLCHIIHTKKQGTITCQSNQKYP